MIGRKEEYEKMARLEEAHWWYRALHRLTLQALERHAVPRSGLILDAGCGTGGLLAHLRRAGYMELRGIDISDDAIEMCRAKSLDVIQGDIREIGRHAPGGDAAAIVCHDVFYFLDRGEWAQTAARFHDALAPDGLVIMNLPAFAAFRGIHDMAVGIRHRFTKRDIGDIFDAARFARLRAIYWPFFLSPLIFGTRAVQRLRLRSRRDVPIRSDLSLPPAGLNDVLYHLTRLENDGLARKPFGSSLFLVMKKTA
ncbi:MAG: hypothetical protein A3G34_12885 [Candidatus Lindowbacteria bacterium RIFCSPLOWO2_12_FULL_62_27]|nr:MAG: hypothetical protein A3I06_15170 [Candidatus Lindowbacteria bacterium RIFCSPLOWO2_02_FULL_62_12]OGH62488.1 MAG: hypothetical protein A3G34_12885 [Candidatus Lindowbacteria bacterium RIFCSPLOWO2_12_FULL_62_27]